MLIKEGKIKEKDLEDVVKYYVKNKDYKTAQNFIKSWGPYVEGYPIDVKLNEVEELKNKPDKKVKE